MKHSLHGDQQGLTLVEMMISITISLILLAGIIQVFVGTKNTYRVQEATSRVQENGRFALDIIARDLRMAGFAGCSNATTLANVVNGGAASWTLDMGTPLQGFDNSAPAGIARVAGDAITVLKSSSAGAFTVTSHNPASATISLSGKHSLHPNDILVISDCTHTSVFQMTNPTNGSNNATTVVHNTGVAGVTPGNCSKSLGLPIPSPCAALGTPYTYGTDARLMRLNATTYYIGTGANGQNALFRSVSGTAEELIEGVEDMQIVYGEDTSGNQAANTYVNAGAVTDWSQVVSARISLLLRTLDDNIAIQAQSYNYDLAGDGTAEAITAGDKRIRRAFTSTIAIRNRVP